MGSLLPLSRWSRFAVRPFDRSLRTPPPFVTASGERWDTAQIGEFGEQLAARWLWLQHGCKVLYRNFRADGGGEVDIVARDRQTLAFIEVKTRTTDLYGRPAAAVTAEKQALVVRGAKAWLRLLDERPELIRFDIVEVRLTPGEKPDLTWLRAAFHLPEGQGYL